MRMYPLTSYGLALSCLLTMPACSPQLITKPVLIPGPVQYVQIPPELLKPCTYSESAITTNRDLLNAYLNLHTQLNICNNQIRAIANLKPPL